MYEGIENIYQLLDAGRVKEALVQLQAIGTHSNRWDIMNRIETAQTAYGYMLQYAKEGMDDPNRQAFYRKTLRSAYELTDEMNIALMAKKTSTVYYDCIRTFALQPAKTYPQLQTLLESFTEDLATAPMLYPNEERRQAEIEKMDRTHESALKEIFNKIWVTPFWSEKEAAEMNDILQSPLVSHNDLAVIVSAATLSLLRVFDPCKFRFLADAYDYENPHVSQRAIIGIVIILCKHPRRIYLYPEIIARLSLLSETGSFRHDLKTIQMQLLITRETSQLNKRMREEIIPEMMKNPWFTHPKFRFDETEEAEDLNPEWEKWMDQNGITEKLQEMGELQLSGADVYIGSFAQLKNYPFFHHMHHWFYPFDINLPILASLKKESEQRSFTMTKIIADSSYFCNSDKYSFCMAMLGIPEALKELNYRQMEEQANAEGCDKEKLETFHSKATEIKDISRHYIQDLYRFFKLWRNHKEEEDIFLWKFDLWQNPLLGDVLQQDETIKELADYLLQKQYLEEAHSLYQKLIDKQIHLAEVYQKNGYILQKQKQYEKAIGQYKQADILLPDNLWTNKHLAQCYKLNGNLEKALEYYRKVESVQPDNLNIVLQIGQCLARMENYTDALAYFYKVEYLEKNPDNARRAIAWCSFVSGKHEEADKYYRMLTESAGAKAQDWMNAAHVHFVNRRIPLAIEHYRKAQETENRHSDFIDKFNKDRNALLSQGLSEEDLSIMLDLLV